MSLQTKNSSHRDQADCGIDKMHILKVFTNGTLQTKCVCLHYTHDRYLFSHLDSFQMKKSLFCFSDV
jgi:hypothetical protein